MDCLKSFADRLLSAYDREMAAKDAEIKRLKAALKKIVDDNSRLIDALKPVMAVHITEDDMTMDVFDSKMDAVKCVDAVREAQRIMKDGEVK